MASFGWNFDNFKKLMPDMDSASKSSYWMVKLSLQVYFSKFSKNQPIFLKYGWFWLKFYEFSKTDIIFEFSVQKYLLAGFSKFRGPFYKIF